MPITSPNGHLTIRAGAGAGKTTAMVNYILQILGDARRAGKSWPRLAVTTFTRKATQELKERVVLKAAELGDAELCAHVQRSSALHISTIHGILTKYLSAHGAAIGLPPNLRFVGDAEEARLRRWILRKTLREPGETSTKLAALLEDGDWNSLWRQIDLWSDEKNVNPAFAPVTPEKLRALREERLRAALGLARDLGERLPREEKSAGWIEYASLLQGVVARADAEEAEGDRLRSLLLGFAEIRPSVRATKNSSAVTMERKDQFHELLKKLDGWEWSEEFIEKHALQAVQFDELAAGMLAAVGAQKRDQGLVLMKDLEPLALELMTAHPATAAAFAADWDFWMVDEFQDTSPRQVTLLEGLSRGKPLFAVGDPQQSIYLFRGARTEVFQEQQEKTRARGGELRELMVNYRSEPKLLGFMNDFFAQFNASFAPMEPGKEPSAGEQPVVYLWRGGEESTEFDALATADRTLELIAGGATPSEICVLARTNLQLDQVATVFTRLRIPFQRSSGGSFFRRREIRDACALLRFILNPHDNVNLVEWLRAPVMKTTDTELVRIGAKLGPSYWRNLQDLFPEHADVAVLRGILARAQEEGVGEAWESAVIELGFLDEAYARDASGEQEARLWRLLSMVRAQERAPGFSYLDFLNRLEDGDEKIEGEVSDVPPARTSDRVQLMTVHASKGLQFAHVILPFVGHAVRNNRSPALFTDKEAGLWSLGVTDPDGVKKSSLFAQAWIEKQRELERAEHDRVLYVAMTRAKQTLTFTWSKAQPGSWAARFPLWDPGEASGVYHYRSHEPRPAALRERLELPAVVSARAAWSESAVAAAVGPGGGPTPAPRAAGSFRTLSVTQLLALNAAKGATADRAGMSAKASLASLHAASEGVRVHKIFESIKYRSSLDGVEPKWRKFLAEFRDGLLRDVIARGYVEWGFLLPVDELVLQGKIDLWGRDAQGVAWVVDYKTGSIESMEKAIRQLEIYSYALRRLGKIEADEKVWCLPLYLAAPEKSRPVLAPSLAQIERDLRVDRPVASSEAEFFAP